MPPITIGWFSRPLPQEYDNKMYLSELVKANVKENPTRPVLPRAVGELHSVKRAGKWFEDLSAACK
jgi:hypothetical protein